MGWTEAEIRATILAYFQLMAAQEAGESPVKVAIYRELSTQFPYRSPKAFERKFQNISATLYELRLPFCDGLKSSANYQRLEFPEFSGHRPWLIPMRLQTHRDLLLPDADAAASDCRMFRCSRRYP